jgi:Lantibiotic biosynthesis dehydratase C-term
MSLWKTLKVFYFEPDKDGLFLDGVLPTLERLKEEGSVEAWFCQRHWLHGPHVRINVRLAAPSSEPAVREALERAAAGYLEHHPSTASLGQEEYMQRYAPIAALELQEEHPLPLFADNSLRWEPLAMTEFKFGGPAGVQIALDVLSATQGVISEVMRRSRGSMPERLFLFARLMLAYCASYTEPALAAVSFLSHAEAYLHGLSNGQELRRRFEASFKAQSPSLIAALRDVADGTEDPLLIEWMSAIQRGYTAARSAAQTGALQPPSRSDYMAYEAAHLPEGIRPATQGLLFDLSPMHRPMLEEDSDLSKLFRTSDFKGRALMVNLVYNKFQSAGLRPLERLYLCSIVTQTIEHSYGRDGWPARGGERPRGESA